MVDFDEFLFTQDGGTEPEQQRRYMDQYFDDMSAASPSSSSSHAPHNSSMRSTPFAGSSIIESKQDLGVEQLLFSQAVPKVCSDAPQNAATCVIETVDSYTSDLVNRYATNHSAEKQQLHGSMAESRSLLGSTTCVPVD